MPQPDHRAESVSPDDRAYDAAVAALARGERIDVDALCREAGGGDDLRGRLEALLHLAGVGDAGSGAPAAKPPFSRLGDFRLLRALGEGSMGVVWLAEQESLKRLVALKTIRAERIGSREAESRFEREALALARLAHPNVVPIHAVGEEHGVRYLAMELVAGESLHERLARAAREGTPLDVPAALRCALDVARALEAAHAAGIIHRDVKPSNILVGTDGRSRLTDFGLALDRLAPDLTRSRGFLGTPFYAAPEQVTGKREAIGPRTDVYSLGATLYESTTGVVPFPADSVEEALLAITRAPLVPPRRRNPALSRDLETVIEKAMERDPARRYASAAEFASDLEALLALRPVAARPPSSLRRAARALRARPILAAALVAVALVALAVPAGVALRGRTEARAALAAAESRIGALATARDGIARLARESGPLARDRYRRPLTDAEETLVRRAESERRALEQRRDEAFHGGLAELSRAAALGAPDADVAAARARLYLELWRERLAAGDRAGAAALEASIVANDRGRVHRDELAGLATLTVAPDPQDAEVFVFRYVEHAEVVPDGEPRLVPVPAFGSSLVAPGSPALRIVSRDGEPREGDLILAVLGRPVFGPGSALYAATDAPPIRRLDRLVAIDGEPAIDRYDLWVLSSGRVGADGEPAERHVYEFVRETSGDERSAPPERIVVESAHQDGPPVEIVDARGLVERGAVRASVLRGGVLEELELPAGLSARMTAAPLPLDASSRCEGAVRLPAGSYLAVVRGAGTELRRAPFLLERGVDLVLRPKLLASGAIPEGFVHVPACRVVLGGDERVASAGETRSIEMAAFFLQEREITFREWLDFLNDPETRAEIDASPIPIRYPRRPENVESGGFLPRGADGGFLLPIEWIDWPVMGVSAEDAEAYARWRTDRERRGGSRFRFRLPTADEWELAARGADLRRYPFGDRFGQRFAKSALSRSVRTDTPFDIMPEPVMSFPIDESPYGIFDLCGSQREWTATDVSRTRLEVVRDVRGGAWNESEPHVGPAAARHAALPTSAEAGYGVRLAADEVER